MKTATRADLNRELIVDRALALVDAEGIAAITIRRLATELNVTPMALYWHLPSKDDLLNAMGDRLFEVMVAPPSVADWAAELAGIVTTLTAGLSTHPGAAHLAAHRVLACAAGRRLAERTLGLLRGAGFDVVAASEIARSAMQTAVMLVTEQAEEDPALPAAQRDAAWSAKRTALAGLSRAEFPNLVECADALTTCEDVDAFYRFGIDLFVSGVQQLQRAL